MADVLHAIVKSGHDFWHRAPRLLYFTVHDADSMMHFFLTESILGTAQEGSENRSRAIGRATGCKASTTSDKDPSFTSFYSDFSFSCAFRVAIMRGRASYTLLCVTLLSPILVAITGARTRA